MTHLQGPVETPFEHGSFQLAIVVPDSYPLVPPNVRFVTRVFHPNVHFKVLPSLPFRARLRPIYPRSPHVHLFCGRLGFIRMKSHT